MPETLIYIQEFELEPAPTMPGNTAFIGDWDSTAAQAFSPTQSVQCNDRESEGIIRPDDGAGNPILVDTADMLMSAARVWIPTVGAGQINGFKVLLTNANDVYSGDYIGLQMVIDKAVGLYHRLAVYSSETSETIQNDGTYSIIPEETWINISKVRMEGTHLQIEVIREDTGEYLAADGSWSVPQVYLYDAVPGVPVTGLDRMAVLAYAVPVGPPAGPVGYLDDMRLYEITEEEDGPDVVAEFVGELPGLTGSCSVEAVAPVVYYVEAGGSDAAAGTASAPWGTLEGARDNVRALTSTMDSNIMVVVRSIFNEVFQLDSNDSGVNGYKVVWRFGSHLQGPDRGGAGRWTEITGWTPESGDLDGAFSAPFTGENIRAIWVNNVRAERAKRGGELVDPVWTTNGYTVGADAILDDPNPTNVEFLYDGNYTFPRNKPASIAGSAITMLQPAHTLTTGEISPNTPLSGTPDTYGFSYSGDFPYDIENCYADWLANAEPGTYYFDQADDRIYYWPRVGEDLATARVMAPAGEERIVEIIGASDIIIRGMEVNFGHWIMADGYASRNTNSYQDSIAELTPAWEPSSAKMIPAAVYVAGSVRVWFEQNCRLRRSTAMGLHITQDCVDCHGDVALVTDTSGIGVVVGDWDEDPTASISSGIRLRNVGVYSVGKEIRSSIGVYGLHWKDSLLRNVEVFDVPYIGLMQGGSWSGSGKVSNVKWLNWKVEHAMFGAHDGGGIYSHKQNSNVVFRRGVIRDVYPSADPSLFYDRAPAIYDDNDCEGVTTEDIVLQDVDLAALFNEIDTGSVVFRRIHSDDSEVANNGGLPGVYQAPIISGDPTVTTEGAAIVAVAEIDDYYRSAILDPVASAFGTLPGLTGSFSSGTAGTFEIGPPVITSLDVTLSCPEPITGVPPYTYQWYRGTTRSFTPGPGTILAGKTTLDIVDEGVDPEANNFWKIVALDDEGSIAISRAVSLGGSGDSFSGDFWGAFVPPCGNC